MLRSQEREKAVYVVEIDCWNHMRNLWLQSFVDGMSSLIKASLTDSLDAVLSDEAQRRAMGERAFEITRPFEYARALAAYANGLRALVGKEALVP